METICFYGITIIACDVVMCGGRREERLEQVVKKVLVSVIIVGLVVVVLGSLSYGVWADTPVQNPQPPEQSSHLQAGSSQLAPSQVVMPTISGADDITLMLGEEIDYRENVTAQDGSGTPILVEVDDAEVDIYTPGEYPLVYTAKDAQGNEAQAAVQVTVLTQEETDVYTMADEVLEGIITPEMTGKEKVKAIHKWVKNNLRYVGNADKISVIDGAYTAFTRRRGDCYTFYAMGEVLLTRAGIENEGVERDKGETRHYWSIVNVGDGWYHFDTCPTPSNTGFDTSMFSESQAEGYTNAMGTWWSYYSYDTSLHPEVEWE